MSVYPDNPWLVLVHITVHGYSLVWDNVQKLATARDHGKDKGNKMLLWANRYAALNHVESCFPGAQNTLHAVDIPLSQFLHNREDCKTLRTRMTTLISRILEQYVAHFTDFYKDVVTWHIHHPYVEASKAKSKMVRILSQHSWPAV